MSEANLKLRKAAGYNGRDLTIALIFSIIGIAAVIATLQIPTDGTSHFDLRSATFFPTLTALIIVVASIHLAVRAVSRPVADAAPTLPASRNLRTCIATCVMAAYGAAIFYVGFWPASSVAIIAMASLLSSKPFSSSEKRWLVATALVVPGIIILTFKVFLAVQMPTGGGY